MIKFFPGDIVINKKSGIIHHVYAVQSSEKDTLVYILRDDKGDEFQCPVDHADRGLTKIGKIKR